MWDVMKEITNGFNTPGYFVTINGYEWTNWELGHRNVYFADDDPPIFRYKLGDQIYGEQESKIDSNYGPPIKLCEAVFKS